MISAEWLTGTNALVLELLATLGVAYLVFGLDDLFIDLVALARRLRPREISPAEVERLKTAPQKKIAILVPAWREAGIIDRMLAGNLSRIEYAQYHFFVGVYPNDPDTAQKVCEVSRRHPNVHAVVNTRNGPTSKGQILNHVVRQILQFESREGFEFDVFLMQDAEDLIHPLTLPLINDRIPRYDFVQIPVFSLDVRARQLVAGTYVDEFAESHTKDILVREAMGAAVPSAGVGTAMSRRLVLGMLEGQGGTLFNEGSLTEDYELGVRAHAAGFRPHVAACWYRDGARREFIATREYFPKKFDRSVRQKTRWTTGITLQGSRNLGWMGSLANRYFLARDRKGIVANVATVLGYVAAALAAAYAAVLDAEAVSAALVSPFAQWALGLNGFLMVWRLGQRAVCVRRVYGWAAVWAIPLRWPLANTINAFAACRAVRQDVLARFTRATLEWVKTEHELPELFGQSRPSVGVAK